MWLFIVVLLLIAIIIGIACYVFPIAIVIGESMNPSFRDGQKILCSRLPVILKKFNEGEVYIYKCPYENKLVIKRLHHRFGDSFYFLGDNAPYSVDSRDYGYIKVEDIVAKVITKSKN